MADVSQTKSDPRGQLFDQLDDTRVGMLGIQGSSQHMQPMTHFLDRKQDSLYFITSRETDLVKAIGTAATAHYCVISDDHDFHACISGDISSVDDREKLSEFWSPAMAAWFEDGQEDPNVTLLKMALSDASVWSSTRNALRFGFEVLRANVDSDHKPDVGEHTVINFRATG